MTFCNRGVVVPKFLLLVVCSGGKASPSAHAYCPVNSKMASSLSSRLYVSSIILISSIHFFSNFFGDEIEKINVGFKRFWM